jgi:multidrug efflux pump subunit AcrA (membrane-fusion protein)
MSRGQKNAEQISRRTAWTSSHRISEPADRPEDQAQVEAALQNDRAQREEMEQGISRLVQQLRHNALAIQQTLVDEQNSGVGDNTLITSTMASNRPCDSWC